MIYKDAIKSRTEMAAAERLPVTSYDSGYEHSLEHWISVQHLVEEADEELRSVPMALVAEALAS